MIDSTSVSEAVVSPVVQVENVVYRPRHSPFELVVSRLELSPGEKVALTGSSGSGKTTLLSLIAGRLSPIQGEIHVLGTNLNRLTPPQREQFRLQNLGIVFQDFRLIEYLTVADNLALKSRLQTTTLSRRQSREAVEDIARPLKIETLLNRYPAKLSQGEQQRTAIGRALFGKPALLLADEPTGNLDPRTAHETLDCLLQATDHHQATLLMVTHDHSLLSRFDRHIDLQDLQ